MASSTSDEIIRLFKCYVETVMDVITGVVDDKLLQPNHWTLQQYLEDKKHLFYHQTDAFKTPSCDCPPAGCILRIRTHTINQKVFYSLYDLTANVEIGHELQQNGRVEQTCIHKYVPKNIDIDDLDIGTMCFMLTTTAILSANEMSSVKTIKNYRNDVCHIWSTNHYSGHSVNNMWSELESSLLTLTCKPHAKRMIQREFRQHRRHVIGTEDISEILEKMSIVTKYVNQLPSRSDFDDFKNVCLQNNNTMQAVVCERICEGTKSIREDIGDLGGKTDKILQAIGNITLLIDYPRRQLVPQNDFKLQGEGKVLWQIETPDNWDLEDVEATVKDNTKLEEQPIKIKFVKTGSLYLLTTVPQSILNSPANFEMAVKSFLENLVDICKFDTSMPCQIEVNLSFLEEGNDTIRVGMADTSYQQTSKQLESGSNTSISTQTDVLDIRCPSCDDTIELDFDRLEKIQKDREILIEKIQKDRKILIELELEREYLYHKMQKERRLTFELQKERKEIAVELQKEREKLTGERLLLKELRRQKEDLADEIQEEIKFTDLDVPSHVPTFEQLYYDIKHSSRLPKGFEKKTIVRPVDEEGIQDSSYLFSKHPISIPKRTKKKKESTKENKGGIPDPSCLISESFLSHEKGTEKKKISTKDDKGVQVPEHIFSAKKQ